MSDIVERLRRDHGHWDASEWQAWMADAADEIDSLRSRLAEVTKLAYIGDHHYPDLTYKARLDELVPQHRALEALLRLCNTDRLSLEARLAEAEAQRAIVEGQRQGAVLVVKQLEARLAEAEAEADAAWELAEAEDDAAWDAQQDETDERHRRLLLEALQSRKGDR